tara:strand:- start:157 stop:900 length:744 start_codon:yes stop_codon:yes gene_type:complete
MSDTPSNINSVYLQLLLLLLKLSSGSNSVEISTNKLANMINKSQQSISQQLSELEKIGFVNRIKDGKGNSIKLTKKATNSLNDLSLFIQSHLTIDDNYVINIQGRVFSGLNEGAYYMSQNGYKKQFKQKLGFTPYPGTLNLKLISNADIKNRTYLESSPGILINSFTTKSRSFSSVKCFILRINDNFPGAAIIIERTHHDESVLEIISPIYLKDDSKIFDDAIITLTIYPHYNLDMINSMLTDFFKI